MSLNLSCGTSCLWINSIVFVPFIHLPISFANLPNSLAADHVQVGLCFGWCNNLQYSNNSPVSWSRMVLASSLWHLATLSVIDLSAGGFFVSVVWFWLWLLWCHFQTQQHILVVWGLILVLQWPRWTTRHSTEMVPPLFELVLHFHLWFLPVQWISPLDVSQRYVVVLLPPLDDAVSVFLVLVDVMGWKHPASIQWLPCAGCVACCLCRLLL